MTPPVLPNLPDVPDWLLERARLGELTPEQQARFDAALREDPTLRARLEALEADDAAFRAAHPAERVVPELERRLHVARTRDAVAGAAKKRTWFGIAVLVPIVAGLGFAVASSELALRGAVEVEEDRIKGLEPRIVVHRQVGASSETLEPGASAKAGDVLQLGYVAAGRAHGVLLSIDGRGAVTLHHPASEGASTALSPDGEVAVPRAYQLDDAPQFERFFLVTDDQPVDVAVVMATAKSLAMSGRGRTSILPLPAGLEQRDVLIVKVPR